MPKKYEVIVGNIGRVYESNNLKEAGKRFREYRRQSKSGVGRAGGESVTIFEEGEPIEEFIGEVDRQDAEDLLNNGVEHYEAN